MDNKNANNQNQNTEEIKKDIEMIGDTNDNENENPNDISEEYIEDADFEEFDNNLIDADVLEYAAHAQDDVIDVKDTAMAVESESQSESSINITNEFENFKAEGEIYSLAMNDKGILIIGDGEENTYFYDVSMKKLLKKEKYNKDSVNHVKITVDGKYILTSSLDGTVNIFSSDNLELLRTVEGSFSEINWLEVHPKGPVFAFGSIDGSVWVYHAQNPETNMSFFGHTESVSCGAFSYDGKYLVTGSEDLTCKIWDLKNNSLSNTIKGKKFHQSAILNLAMAKKKNIIATGSNENELGICNAENGNETISKIAISNQQSYLVYMSGSHGTFYVFDTRGNGTISQKEKVHSDVILDFHITKDENFAITSSLDKTINLVKIVNL